MALLNSGLKLSSSGSGASLGSITIATTADAAFPATTTTGNGSSRVNTGGAAIFTVNPIAPTVGTTFGTIVAGPGATLYVEYNPNGQYRFDVVTGNGSKSSPTLVSQWYAFGTEHTVGVNYSAVPTPDNTDPVSALITLAVDGKVASSQVVAFTSLAGGTAGLGLSIGSFGTVGNAGNFNGYIDQYVVFKPGANLSPGEFASYTNDAAGIANALAGHIETQTVSSVNVTSTIDNPHLYSEAHPNVTATGAAGSTSLALATAAATETSTITFTALTNGQSVSVAGRTLTATGAVSANEVANAFANGVIPTNATLTGAISGWTSTNSGATVTFTSALPSANVADLFVITSGATTVVAVPTPPTVVTTQAAITESNVVTFANTLTVGQGYTIGGRTVTATGGTATIADIVSAFSSGVTTGFAVVSGALAGWTMSTLSGTTLGVVSTTINTDVADLTATAVGGGTGATIAKTDGATTPGTEAAVATFANGLIAGQSMNIAGRTVTASGTVTTAELVTAFGPAATAPANATVTGGIVGWTPVITTAGSVVTFTSTTATTDVPNLSVSVSGQTSGAPSLPTVTTTIQGSTVNLPWVAATDPNNSVQIGDLITGTNVPTGDFVTGVTGTTGGGVSAITLREGLSVAKTATSNDIQIFHPEAITHTEITVSTTPTTSPATLATTSDKVLTGETTLKLESIAGVRTGDFVAGTGIPSGYVVKAHLPANITTLQVDPSTDFVTIAPITETYTSTVGAGLAAVGDTVTIGGRTATALAVATATELSAALSTGTTTAKIAVSGTLSGWVIDNPTATSLIIYSTLAGNVTDLTASGNSAASTPLVKVNDGNTSSFITSAIPVGATLYFVDPLGKDTQKINLASTATSGTTYVAGDIIQIIAASGSGTTVSRNYVVQSADLKSTVADTLKAIAASIVTSFPRIGLYDLAADGNGVIYMAPELTPLTASLSGTFPKVVVNSLNAAQVNENNVLDAYNFSAVASAATSVARSAGTSTPALFLNSAGSSLTASIPGAINYNGGTTTTTGAQAVPQLKGPIFAELASSSAPGDAVYNLFINSGSVQSTGLSSLGFTINQPAGTTSGGQIMAFTPTILGTLNQSNISGDNTSVNYQWVSASPISDFTKPFATIRVKNSDPTQAFFTAQATNISVNGSFLTDPVTPTIPMVETLSLNNAVYSVSGTIYQQYNSGTSRTAFAAGASDQVVMGLTDLNYTVTSPSANLNLKLQPFNTAVTAALPNANIKIDVIDNNLVSGANAFSFNLNIPSNATNVSFTAAAGVTGLSVVNKGGYLTVSGSYTTPTAAAATATAGATGAAAATGTTTTAAAATSTVALGTLGTLSANLLNTFNTGSQFSIDSAVLVTTASTGQALYFGTAETTSAGVYTLSNLPSGLLTLNILNNVNLATQKSNNVGLNDAISALNIAAGRGLYTTTAGAATTGVASALQVSDFVAADWNRDGKITASDALNILQYYVNYTNIGATPLSYTYFPSSLETFVGDGKVGVANAFAPAIPSFQTATNVTTGAAINKLASNSLDIIGVLQGDIVVF